MSVSEFDAFRIFEADGKVEGRIVKATLDELSEGEVVIRTAYSSVNYKDALAATGAGKIVRNFPLIGGIDVAGSVVSSTDSAFGEGDEVLVHSYDLGVAHDGGYAEYVRVPAKWVVPLPEGLTAFNAMAIGRTTSSAPSMWGCTRASRGTPRFSRDPATAGTIILPPINVISSSRPRMVVCSSRRVSGNGRPVSVRK